MNLGPEVPAEAKVVVEDERSRQHVAHDVDDDDEHCELSATPETTHIDHLFVFVVSNQHLHLPPYHQKLNFPQNKSDIYGNNSHRSPESFKQMKFEKCVKRLGV